MKLLIIFSQSLKNHWKRKMQGSRDKPNDRFNALISTHVVDGMMMAIYEGWWCFFTWSQIDQRDDWLDGERCVEDICIYIYIYLEEIKGWWYWWKIYGSKFLLQNCGTLRSFVLGGGVSRAGSLFSVKGSQELERDVEGFKEGEEKVAGSSNAISYKRMIYSFAIVFLLPQSLKF